eukprot:130430_1
MLSHKERKQAIITSIVCSCLAIIFGICGIVFWFDSFLNIRHECEVYYITTEICEYACGQTCTYSSSSSESESESESESDSDDIIKIIDRNNKENQFINFTNKHIAMLGEHCVTQYCWGYEYVFYWKTMDWLYPPYQVQTSIVERNITNSSELHNYLASPFMEKTSTNYNLTLHKLKTLLNEINNNSSLTKFEINIQLKMLLDEANNMNININASTSTATNTTLNPYDVNWCDYRRPAYVSYGSCAAFPYQWYSYGDTEVCWTNDKCSSWSTLSPFTNYDLAKGFGFTAIVCLGILCVLLLVIIVNILYQKFNHWYEYEYIPTEDNLTIGEVDQEYSSGNINDAYTIQ